jgi:hypothetical protein
MKKLDPDKKTLRQFGVTLGVAFLVIAGVLFLRQKYVGAAWCSVVAGAFLIAGAVSPVSLGTVYIGCMRFASILERISTRIVLILLFYLIITPFGLVMRLFRADPLERKNKAGTCWKKKEKVAFNPSDYERRF